MNPLPPPATQGRILVADDDEAFRRSTVQVLKFHGFSVEGACDGPSALEWLVAGGFDLLISDISMPGNEKLELIRGLPERLSGLPVILLTGHPTVETATESFRLPVVAYLTKPLEVTELLAVVRRAIADGRALRSLDAHRERLLSWCHSLDSLRSALRTPGMGSEWAEPRQAYLTLSINHIIESLLDLRAFTEHLVEPDAPATVARRLESSRPLVLLEALRDTIAVLEKTKSSFKSKELGDLRVRLEQLVRGTRGGSGPGAGAGPDPGGARLPEGAAEPAKEFGESH